MLGFDGQDDGLDLVALLHDLGRMLHALGPAHVADVDEAVNAVFDLDEGAELGEIAYFSFDGRADGILIVQLLPRIRSQLLHAERDAAFAGIHAEHHGLDLIANVDDLRWVLHALRPGHLADVDQAFDALLEFDERAVVGGADDASFNVRADRVALHGVEPRIRRELLEAERYALLLGVVFQNFYLDLIADMDQVAGMSEASPAHVCDVEQAVEAAQIDERTVVGQVLHRAVHHRALFEVLERLAAELGLLLVEDLFARDHDVAALLVQLYDPYFQLLALHVVEVAHGLQVDLRAGQERAGAAEVDGEATLDALDDDALDGLLLVVGFLNIVPDFEALRLLIGELNHALFHAVGHDFDLVAGGNLDVAVVVFHLLERHEAFGLGAEVDDHVFVRDLDHGALDHALFGGLQLDFFLFCFEVLKYGCEIFHVVFVVSSGSGAVVFRACGTGLRSGFLVDLSGSCGCDVLLLGSVLGILRARTLAMRRGFLMRGCLRFYQ